MSLVVTFSCCCFFLFRESMDTDKDDPHGRYHEPSYLNFSVLIAISLHNCTLCHWVQVPPTSQWGISKEALSL